MARNFEVEMYIEGQDIQHYPPHRNNQIDYLVVDYLCALPHIEPRLYMKGSITVNYRTREESGDWSEWEVEETPVTPVLQIGEDYNCQYREVSCG